jgi:D-alanyl-D-alanine carboxypeptidase/D-alanyl-D-alanine-endopeptidase (penicillin-binding protein 4)
MRALLACVLFALAPLAGIAAPATGAARALPAEVRDALARAGVPLTAASVVVEPVDGQAPLVSHQAGNLVNPASVMKLVTTYAALDLLGPAFVFHTDVLLAGELSGGTLNGDLVIRGGGDPKLTAERVWQLLHELRSRGLREIRGDIVIDRGYFAPVAYDPARFDNDPRRAYNVGPDAFLVNFQVVDFHFIPDGDGVRVIGEPDLPNVEIASRIRLTKDPCGSWRRGLQHDITEDGLIATAVFSGRYPADCGEKSWPLALFDGPRFTEAVLRWIWSESGGVLRGRVRPGPTPANATLFLRFESEPLANLVRDMNKFSNNVMARQVFLALSAERGAPGEARASETIVREWLATKAIEPAGLAIENGAGLSRDDRISAAGLAAILRSAWMSPVMPELAASMPVFATDGTLKTRRGAGATGQAHLKGGTLNGVQSIAGYELDRNGHRWIVVMILNHPNANAAQPAIDALVEWVHDRPEDKRVKSTAPVR